jgi:uracil-DNA glycosylase family 4
LSKKVLNDVAAEVKNCRKCLLWKTRKNAVPGEGNSKNRIMFVGEAPGRQEDLTGRPFVGAAGKFLETLLNEIELSRNDVFICNVLKCRPPRNRQPRPDEILTCTPYLDRQIRAIKPRVIVTLGNHSTARVFAEAGLPFEGITQAHGKPRRAAIAGRRATIFPTYHPAAALYNGAYRKQLTEDFEALKRILAGK